MKKKLKLTILLLLVASISFAQQTVVNNTKHSTQNNTLKLEKEPVEKAKTKKKKRKISTRTASIDVASHLQHSAGLSTHTEGDPIQGSIIKGGCNGLCDHKFTVITKDDGSFSTKLEEGNYTISLNADEFKKTITELKSKNEKINGATFVFDSPANFEFSGTEIPNEKGEYVAPKFEFTIIVPKEGITFSGKLLTTTTLGLSIKPTVNERGSGSPKQAGF
ncbi:MAG: hypothetical protein J0M25_04570 [Flavobacteriales bacterium]|nr:hypothetical protein [Flavobacteriales bacterium]